MSISPSDDQLLKRLRRGHTDGLDGLFRRYYRLCCQSADRIVRNSAAAEDIVQDLFVYLWNKRTTLPAMDQVSAYLRRATRNRSLNYLRDRNRIPDTDGEMPDLADQSNSPVAKLELEELRQRVDQAIDNLPERCRLIYVLCRLEDMPRSEVAQQLGISVKTVENQMTRAYRFLHKQLDDQG